MADSKNNYMVLFKKIIFAFPFLIIFTVLIYQISPLLASYDFIFSLSLTTLLQLITVSTLICTSSLLFSLLVTVASDWKITLPISIISVAVPFAFAPSALALILAVAIFVSLLLTNINLDSALKSYLNFQPTSILGPSVRHLSGFLIISFCLVYFFSASQVISQKGFQIPDSLIDTALKMAPRPETIDQTQQSSLPQLTAEQLDLLKKNPEALKQFGLDPNILENLTKPQKGTQPPVDLTNELIKQTVKDQLQNFIKPYINFVPAVLVLLLFLTLQSLVSILNLLIYPLLWLTFLIFEKTGFIKFETEQRPVKKLVV